MASTTFVDQTTPIVSAWLNDINNSVYGNSTTFSVANVKLFGAKGDGTTDDTTAFQNAINSLQTNGNYRGGVVFVPPGHYKLSNSLTFTAYAAAGLHNMYLKGSGAANTYLDFSGTTGTMDGIIFDTGSYFGISDLFIAGAARHGIALNLAAFQTSNYSQQWYIRDVRTSQNGVFGVASYNSFMGEMSNVYALQNTNSGFNFGGYHTSINLQRCYAQLNGNIGFDFNGITYSNFISCGSDSNTAYGYALQNAAGINYIGCGAETNVKDAFYMATGTIGNTSIPSSIYGIRAVSLINCFAFQNSTAGAGLYASFLSVTTGNSTNATVNIQGGMCIPNAAGDIGLILKGNSGTVTVNKNLYNDAAVTAADTVTGANFVSDFTRIGRLSSVVLNANQSIPNTTNTLLTPAAAFTTNTLSCTIAGNTIVIPSKVNSVRVSCSVDFAASAVGVRQVYILHNNSQGVGLPTITMNALSAGDTVISLSSSIIPVAAGDTFSFQVYQNSGGALNVTQSNLTWFAVEGVA